MNTVELFAGTRSFSKVAESLGHNTFTTDAYEIDGQDLISPIEDLHKQHFPSSVDMLWASPPCEGFSVAAIGKSWNHDNTPKSDTARYGLLLVEHTWRLIDEIKPTWWFIENPRGKLRKLPTMERSPVRHTVTYCQYGDTRMKPTDIWTNAYWWKPRPICKNGSPCHIAAPRGSRTGTQGVGSYKDKSRIPPELFREIFSQLL